MIFARRTQKVWKEYFQDAPDKPLMFGGVISSFLGDHSLVPAGKYMMVRPFLSLSCSSLTLASIADGSLLDLFVPSFSHACIELTRLADPLSKGSVHITSSDPFAAPDFDAGFLSHPADMDPQVRLLPLSCPAR